MFLQIFILTMFLSVALGIIFFFHLKNISLKEWHLKKLANIESAISLNSDQIKFRNAEMEHYSFLEYNLNESLVIQPKIVLY